MLSHYSDQTMWGPQGDPNKDRPRLKPGDRLADGRIFMGDNPEATLRAELARVEDALRPLAKQYEELSAKLAQLTGPAAPAEWSPAPEAGTSKPETAPKAKAKRG